MLDAAPTTLKPKRRWHQFSLKWLFVVVAVVAVACGWFKSNLDRSQRLRAIEAAIFERGGILLTDLHPQKCPTWKVLLFGERSYPLTAVTFKGCSEVSDVDLRRLAAIDTLVSVCLEGTDVTDSGLAELKVLTNLKLLLLTSTRVTDDGVADFRRALPDCMIERQGLDGRRTGHLTFAVEDHVLPGLNFIDNSHRKATNFDEKIREPTQFSLQGLFVATLLVGVALSVFKCFGPFTMILSVQCAAVVAVLFKSKGTAWPGVVVMGLAAPLPFILLLPFYGVLFVASLGAWFGGGTAADIESKRRSVFLRWSALFALIWFLALVVIGIIVYED